MVKAIIWDYDGTLVDTRRKNLEVTKEIMREVMERNTDKVEVLQSLQSYQEANDNSENWRALYKNYFNLSDDQIDEAGAMWKEYQVKSDIEVLLFDHIREALADLSDCQHGIVSQNAYENIISYLSDQRLGSVFSKIIGYEEIGYDQQKPNPAGLLACVEHLVKKQEGSVLYVGDHETDIQCALQANSVLKEKESNMRIYSVAALYGLTESTQDWSHTPDFKAGSPKDIIAIARNLSG